LRLDRFNGVDWIDRFPDFRREIEKGYRFHLLSLPGPENSRVFRIPEFNKIVQRTGIRFFRGRQIDILQAGSNRPPVIPGNIFIGVIIHIWKCRFYPANKSVMRAVLVLRDLQVSMEIVPLINTGHEGAYRKYTNFPIIKYTLCVR
jgi:hypothetical protein